MTYSVLVVMASNRMSLTDRMKATKLVEEELRPALPAKIQPRSTWTLAAQELMNESPESYAGIVARLAEGDTNVSVSKLTGLPIELIRKIRELHPNLIEVQRRAAHARIEEALHAASAKLVDNIDKIKPAQLGILVGILTDKSQLLSGGATSRVETIKVASPEDLQQMFNQLPEAKAEVITIEEEKK